MGSVTVDNCEFTSNKSLDKQGGAIAYSNIDADNASLKVIGGSFTENKGNYGGAIYISGFDYEEVKITGASFTANEATSENGGAICSEEIGSLSLANCRITGNISASAGGGVSLYYVEQATVCQSLIADNNSIDDYWGKGGGIYVESVGSIDISWSTIANNVRGKDGSYVDDDLYFEDDADGSITNSIIHATELPDTVTASNVISGSAADLFTDGTNADPKLRDYTLKAGSAAINASGVNSGEPVTDLAGNTRAGHGSAYDCGAYEYQGASPASLPYSDAADAAFDSLGEDDLKVDFNVF